MFNSLSVMLMLLPSKKLDIQVQPRAVRAVVKDGPNYKIALKWMENYVASTKLTNWNLVGEFFENPNPLT